MNPHPARDDFDDAPTDPGVGGPRARVLVAEDDPALRQLIVQRMRREGFEVLEACSGDDAMIVLSAIVQHVEPRDALDLLVMDVRMPGTSGIEVTRQLRLARWTMPVLLITAYPDASLLAEATRLNAAVLAKPFALDRLSDAAIAALVSPALGRHRLAL